MIKRILYKGIADYTGDWNRLDGVGPIYGHKYRVIVKIPIFGDGLKVKYHGDQTGEIMYSSMDSVLSNWDIKD